MKIKVRFEIDDGYVGGSRPHSFTIDSDDYEGQSPEDIANNLSEEVEQEMLNIAHPVYEESKIVQMIVDALKKETTPND